MKLDPDQIYAYGDFRIIIIDGKVKISNVGQGGISVSPIADNVIIVRGEQ